MVRLIHCVAGLMLLFAAAMKSNDLRFISSIWGSVGLIQLELALGLWLLTGYWSSRAHWTALVCFSIFTAVSMNHTLRGHMSCGCFGRLDISPWFTTCMDLAAVAGLVLFRPKQNGNSRRRLIALIGSVIITSAAVWTWVGLHQPVAFAEEIDGSAAQSGIVLLEPDKWVQKRLPLLSHIEQGDQLATGDWIIVLYHHDCDTCRQAIPKYQQLSLSENAESKAPQLAFIEMPTYGDPSESIAASPHWLALKLKPDRDWFATTPVVIRLKDGIVLAAAEGEEAIDPSCVGQAR